jgi:hypothetical protein
MTPSAERRQKTVETAHEDKNMQGIYGLGEYWKAATTIKHQNSVNLFYNV